MRNIINTICLVLLMSYLMGCNNDSSSENELQPQVAELYEQNEYNQDLRDFALAVSNTMNNSKQFRQLIKKEALAMFDGDYDVLLRKIVDHPVKADNDIQLRNSGANSTVKDLLESYYDSTDLSGASLRSTASIISELQQKYPNLQITIPVNADKWDENTTTPIVAFIPMEYKDGVTRAITGYTPSGNAVILDAVIPPSEAVIVVSQNERNTQYKPNNPAIPIGGGDCHLPQVDPNIDRREPPAPTNLTATPTTEGVRLDWNQSVEVDVIGYYIYRKGNSDANFSSIAVNNGRDNRVHYDKNAESGKIYSYYVIAYNHVQSSKPSNIVSAEGLRPSTPSSFEVRQHTDKQIELRWTTENQNFQTLNLYKQLIGTDDNYNLFKQFGRNTYDYFDKDIIAGKKYSYKLQAVSPTGISNPKYDYIRIPYRNPSYPSPVKIKSIYCNDQCEGWAWGAPEFTIKVLGVKADGTAYEIQSIDIDFENYGIGLGYWDRIQYFDKLVVNWQPDMWYDKITFYVEERDSNSSSTVNLSASANYKTTTDLTVQVAGSISTQLVKGYTIGYEYLDYFDPTDKTLVFPGSGFKMTVGM